MLRESIHPAVFVMPFLILSGVANSREPGNLLGDACGDPLETAAAVTSPVPAVKPIATFEGANPFSGGVVVASGAPKGARRCGSTDRM